MMRFVLVMLLLGACDKEETETTAEADTDTDTDTDTDSDTDTDTDTDPTQITLSVTDARYECEGLDTAAPDSLTVEAGSASGTASVEHLGVQTGCCPSLDISAVADAKTSEVTVSYNLDKDPCDCICTIDLFYTLNDLPSGAWTVDASGSQATVTIP